MPLSLPPPLINENDDDAKELVRGYMAPAPDATGGVAFTGSLFDTWAGGGTKPDCANRFTDADINANTRAGAHNGRVTAIAWTLVGLMAGSLGVLSAALYSGLGRIDALGARLDSRIDSLGARIDAQGAHLGTRIDALGTELRGDIRDLRNQVHGSTFG